MRADCVSCTATLRLRLPGQVVSQADLKSTAQLREVSQSQHEQGNTVMVLWKSNLRFQCFMGGWYDFFVCFGGLVDFYLVNRCFHQIDNSCGQHTGMVTTPILCSQILPAYS